MMLEDESRLSFKDSRSYQLYQIIDSTVVMKLAFLNQILIESVSVSKFGRLMIEGALSLCKNHEATIP